MNQVIKLVLLILILSSWVQNAMATPTVEIEENIDSFNQALESLRKSNRIPGMSVAIVSDNQLAWSNGYGFADNNNEVPITADTPFWVASVTKTFVGLAYLHLEQVGKVNFDEPATKTPEFDDLCEWLAGTTIPFAKGLDCAEPITIRHILHHQVNKPVGTSFMYNPIMYSRLSRHLEHSLGEGVRQVEGRHNYLAQSIDKYILRPANMQRTMASLWDRSKPLVYFDMADGFKVDEEGYKTRMKRPERHIAGGAGVVSTALDLAKYDIAIATGKVVSGNIERQLMQPAKFSDGTDSPYGFGWYFQCYRGEKLMWHSGWDPDNGYSAIHLRLPQRKMAFILLANGEGLWWESQSEGAKRIEESEFVQLFFQHFNLATKPQADCR
jgi:CubicO group peptidase (beta-lactamase class C family)